MVVRELLNLIGFKVDENQLKKSNQRIDKFKRGLLGIGKAIGIGLVALGGYSIKAASDAEETYNKFKVVYDDVLESATSTAKGISEGFGLSHKQATEFLADTGDLLTGLGATDAEALNLAKQVTELGVDLASFTNLEGGAERAVEALTKGMLGEREMMKALGISILEADLKEFAADQGLVYKELTKMQKAQVTLNLAMTQSKNAIGDFQRSSESFANQLRILSARTQDVIERIGMKLLPTATKVLNKLISLFEGSLGEMLDKILSALDPILNAIIGLLDVILPYLAPIVSQFLDLLLPTLIKILGIITKLLDPLLQIVSIILKPVFALLEAILPLVEMILDTFAEMIFDILPDIIPLIEEFSDLLILVIKFLSPILKILMRIVLLILKMEIESVLYATVLLLKLLLFLLQPLMMQLETMTIAFEYMDEVIAKVSSHIENWFKSSAVGVESLRKKFEDFFFGLTQIVPRVVNKIKTIILGLIKKIYATIQNTLDNIFNFMESIVDKLGDLPFVEKIKDMIGAIREFLSTIFANLLTGTIKIVNKVFRFINLIIGKLNEFPFMKKKLKGLEVLNEEKIMQELAGKTINNKTDNKTNNINIQQSYTINGGDTKEIKKHIDDTRSTFSIELRKVLMSSGGS